MGCSNSKGVDGNAGGGQAPVENPGAGRPAPGRAQSRGSAITENKIEVAMKVRRRHENVFAEAPDLTGGFQTARFPKSPEVKDTIRKALQTNFVFSTLSPPEIEDFIDFMKMEKFMVGATVIKQGDPGDFFYVCEAGNFTYSVDGKTVGTAHPGSSFGELALMYNAPRAATVRADEDSVVWSLNRQTFRTILANSSAQQSDRIIESLKKVEILKDVPYSQLASLAGAVQLITYAPGDKIVKKGERGNIFYMIKSGTVLCTDAGSGSKPQKFSSGDYFGEKALLTNEPRAANVTAETACTVFALDRQGFNSTLGDIHVLLEKNLNLRVLRSVPILSKLEESELQAVSELMASHTFKKGQKIITQGEVGHSFYIVKSGEASAQADGKELKVFKEGDFFGEMALLNDEPRVCDVIAIADKVVVYDLDRDAFNRILGSLEDIMKRAVSKRTKQNAKAGFSSKLTGGGGGGANGGSPTEGTSLRDIPKKQLADVAFLGTGTFGRVTLVQDKKSGETMALKAMSKAQIVAHRQQENVMNEKNIMVLCNSPFILKLYATYKDSQKLYLLLEFCQGGELFTVLHTAERDGVPEKQALFYGVCVISALQHMDAKSIAYRDLKPENALIDKDGYCKIIDMGFAKVVRNKTFTLCGTPEYLAPEIVLGRGHNRGVDHWAFGILCYEMIAGYSPFADLQNMDQVVICQNIVKGKLTFPKGFDPNCRDLIKKLLVRDPVGRLGMMKGGVQAICDQPWFKDVDWAAYQSKKQPAPWIPDCGDPLDVSNFDPYDQEEYYDPNFKDSGDWDKEF
ncbi:hypothetical protein TrST_g13324 [Triparma strigata]|uniref:cGMP-dependent protein kinase n=1 Tax=Triparma strigata TaxID=1606541 RepID=A0A9W6ZRR4_9STRA|nr:hypothetical protein TrST_g13324 [Triparma strigata]